jgi:hypothetical protein
MLGRFQLYQRYESWIWPIEQWLFSHGFSAAEGFRDLLPPAHLLLHPSRSLFAMMALEIGVGLSASEVECRGISRLRALPTLLMSDACDIALALCVGHMCKFYGRWIGAGCHRSRTMVPLAVAVLASVVCAKTRRNKAKVFCVSATAVAAVFALCRWAHPQRAAASIVVKCVCAVTPSLAQELGTIADHDEDGRQSLLASRFGSWFITAAWRFVFVQNRANGYDAANRTMQLFGIMPPRYIDQDRMKAATSCEERLAEYRAALGRFRANCSITRWRPVLRGAIDAIVCVGELSCVIQRKSVLAGIGWRIGVTLLRRVALVCTLWAKCHIR